MEAAGTVGFECYEKGEATDETVHFECKAVLSGWEVEGETQCGRRSFPNLRVATLNWRRALTGSGNLRSLYEPLGLSRRYTDRRRSLSCDHLGTATKMEKKN